MPITNYSLQKIIRTYHRQLAEKARLSRERVFRRFLHQDSLTISQENKKRLLADRITQEIMTQFLNASERNETTQVIMSRLSQEYGKPLDVSVDDEQNIVFKVLHKENGEEGGYLSPPENEQLKKRLFDITRLIVYNNII